MAASKNAKKEFDKDYIFNLIMPSDPVAPPPEELEPEEPVPTPVGPSPQDSLSALHQRIRQTPAPAPSVQLKTNPPQDTILINLMERLVVERLDEAFSKFNCCRCDKCRRDVAAHALNALTPQYVVAGQDDLPQLLEECSTREVSAALVKAILYVKNHPNH